MVAFLRSSCREALLGGVLVLRRGGRGHHEAVIALHRRTQQQQPACLAHMLSSGCAHRTVFMLALLYREHGQLEPEAEEALRWSTAICARRRRDRSGRRTVPFGRTRAMRDGDDTHRSHRPA